MSTREEIRRPGRALPFWMSLGMIPIAMIGARIAAGLLGLKPADAVASYLEASNN